MENFDYYMWFFTAISIHLRIITYNLEIRDNNALVYTFLLIINLLDDVWARSFNNMVRLNIQLYILKLP